MPLYYATDEMLPGTLAHSKRQGETLLAITFHPQKERWVIVTETMEEQLELRPAVSSTPVDTGCYWGNWAGEHA